MNGMKHSSTMGQKRRDDHVRSRGNGGRNTMDKSHRNYSKGRRQGGPFGK